METSGREACTVRGMSLHDGGICCRADFTDLAFLLPLALSVALLGETLDLDIEVSS